MVIYSESVHELTSEKKSLRDVQENSPNMLMQHHILCRGDSA